MTVAELASLEDRVFGQVRAEAAPVSTADLLERYRDALGDPTGQELRIAVWNLVNAGRLRFDADWNLQPVEAER